MSPSPTDAAPDAEPQTAPLGAAWVATGGTCRRLGPVLQTWTVGLLDEMVEPTLVCPRCDCGQLHPAPGDVVPYDPPRLPVLELRRTAESLAAELKKRKVALLHALDGPAAALTARVARAISLPYVLAADCLGDVRRLRRWAAGAGAVLAASERLRDALAAALPCPAERLHLLRPGVHHVHRPTCFRDPGRSAAIVAAGPLDRPGPFETVLRCFAELSARKYDCVYLLMGEGPAERTLRRRAAELGLREQLTFVADQPARELPGIFKAADVYVSPVTGPCVDIRSLLALAAGVPVLAARGEGVDDFLHDGRTVTLFAPDDPAELTVKLAALLDEPDAAAELAATGLEYVRTHHGPAAGVAALAGIYRQVLAAGR